MVSASPALPSRDRWSGWPAAVSQRLERVAAAILCVAIVAGPLLRGGTLAWACFGLEAAMAAAAILWAVARQRPPTALVIPLAVGALVLAQLVPLPDRLLTEIAPISAGAWKVAHEGMPEAWGRISITPAASAAAARRLLLGVATILVVADLTRDPRRRRWVFTALATAGGLVWLLGAVLPTGPDADEVFGAPGLLGATGLPQALERPPMQTKGVAQLAWVTVGDQRYMIEGPLPDEGVGPYIYANHFANALCLTLPALCAVWLAFTRKRLPRSAALAGIVVILAAGLWANHAWAASRAGTASLLFGSVVYLALVVESSWLRWLFGGIAAAGLLAIVVFMGVLQGPLEGLIALVPDAWQPQVVAAFDDARLVASRIAGRMFLASPLMGTGLGSYGALFPRFYDHGHIMYFAHNDHAQLWAEAGLAGVFVSGLAAAVLGHRFVRFCRERRPASRSIDAAVWAALAAGAAHSVFDWNMHVPANALLACVVVGLALSSVVPRAVAAPRRRWASRLATAGFVAAVVWATALLARDAWLEGPVADLRRAISAGRLASSAEDRERAAERLTAVVARAETAHGYAGRDWRLPVLIGQARLHLAAAAAAGVDVEPSAGRSAEEWFREAVLASPAARGLGEPVRGTPPR